jgi:alpha-L-rhamnosidase
VAIARVTADSRFVLFVNGEEVARGPARSSAGRLNYHRVDLAPRLQAGENTVAALVRFYGRPGPWWQPSRPSNELGFGSFAFEAPALDLFSDSSWRGLPAPYQREVNESWALLPPIPHEIVDGALVPDGWTTAKFDDSGWPFARELQASILSENPWRIEGDTYSPIEYCDLEPLTSIELPLVELAAVPLRRAGDADPVVAYLESKASEQDRGVSMRVFDAGRITLATPWIEMTGSRGAALDLYAGEELRPDGSIEILPRCYAARYRLAGNKPERFDGFEACGFRYLGVVADAGIEVHGIGATERRYPRVESASFACDDPELEAIWAAGARTVDVCSTDAFLDCPGREQRAWLADSYVQILVSLVTNPDTKLVRQMLRLGAEGRRSDGLRPMVAACDLALTATTSPDFSLHWLRALARYYEYSGDAETVFELLPAAREVLDGLELARGEDGLLTNVPGWVFIDWAQVERADIIGAFNALYACALDDYRSLADQLSYDPRGAIKASERAERTRQAFEVLWDEERGVYVDAADKLGPRRRVSQHTNALAILSGCAPASRWDRMLDYILTPDRLVVTLTPADVATDFMVLLKTQWDDPSKSRKFDVETNVIAAQPFFCHFVHQAVARAGRRVLIPDLCRQWASQLVSGHGTFAEFWEASSSNFSRAHGWSSTPTFDLATYVLGIRPTEPGCRQVTVSPLFGSLSRLAGHFPTPHGLLALDLTPFGGHFDIPEGVSLNVVFEDADLPGGEYGPGRHKISVSAADKPVR